MKSLDSSVIPSISDPAANEANIAAIDKLVKTRKYHHIVAWGKWLGFSPQTVQQSVEQAEADQAPEDAIQKIDRRWQRVAQHRQRDESAARRGPGHRCQSRLQPTMNVLSGREFLFGDNLAFHSKQSISRSDHDLSFRRHNIPTAVRSRPQPANLLHRPDTRPTHDLADALGHGTL